MDLKRLHEGRVFVRESFQNGEMGNMRIIAGRAFVITSLSLLFLAYSNFLPTSVSSALIADYVKNHFVREVIFGVALTAIAIRLAWRAVDMPGWLAAAMTGSIVVLPFWVAFAFGWSTGGLAEVWGGQINEASAYWLHGGQVIGFYLGIALMWPGGDP